MTRQLGIIETLFVDEGDQVATGDLLAKIKVVPNEQSLNSAEGRLANSRILLKNTELEFNRNKDLFDKGIISKQDFDNVQLRYNQAKQDVSNAVSDLQIIRLGSKGGAASANTNIRATVPGTVLEIPVEEGFQVIASNSFNAGTTIATEYGITSANADLMKTSDNPAVKRLVGAEGELGAAFGLDNEWSLRIIKQVGNYGESYKRNIADTGILPDRGPNELWTKGGILYVPPAR